MSQFLFLESVATDLDLSNSPSKTLLKTNEFSELISFRFLKKLTFGFKLA